MEGKILGIIVYLCVVFFLGYHAWKRTKQSTDYMLAGRGMNPFVLAMSYGATFVSTSAIIGFGGVSGMFGMSLLWLTFLTIFVGIFIAMVFFGKRTRRMGLALNAHTFPELLGRRYHSKFIQQFSGVVIFVFIPVYAAAVLIGISRMLEVAFPAVSYGAWLLIVTAIVAMYVITGGLKAVMYTDAFQGTIMAAMMLILMVTTYSILGGVTEAHQALTDMIHLIPTKLQHGGLVGWTTGPHLQSPIGLTIYTTIIYGVGIGVLAQPQLAIRFMTVPSDRELNRAVAIGGVFILLMTGVAFLAGALSNVVFFNEYGKTSLAMAGGNFDKIIPLYIDKIMPGWFSGLFLVAMFAAAMSTMSSQYHVGGTSLSRDFLEQHVAIGNSGSSMKLNRLGVTVAVIATLVWAWLLPGGVIARATAFFFGLCAASFLPIYLLGLYWKGMTKIAAKISMVGGFIFSMFWLLFIHLKEAGPIGLCQALTGQVTLVANAPSGSWVWLLQWVDPNVVALPVSLALAIGISLVTRRMEQKHLDLCWKGLR
ncbi:sodium:solute symporter family protein [Pseudodesulfovibrio sp. JC047]|uniref:sodium:solute symporter family protein n=1 Tax=Pseudodesulfovibrio sp. JC047 TaxID=2683199 RepID=UPI0013D05D63|nr:sodium:solute symporter family protein [Pseudodesulfovibrio sp. JC047]NDV19157.1 sodium:solute symporter family protein [Pseudodesulfovibrio sp. JC047]